MEPQIQYRTMDDGARIAFTASGDGYPCVFVLPQPGSVELDYDLPEARAFYDGLQPGRMLVRYDPRGWGASDRETRRSFDRDVADLACLVDSLGISQFDLFGGPGALPAIAYAARFPNRVSRLVLWEPGTHTSPTTPEQEAERVLIRSQWAGATRVMADYLAPRASIEVKKWITRVNRHCATADSYLRLGDFEPVDVRPELPNIRCPTLILHARRDHQIPLEMSRGVAALIPGARLASIEGDTAFFYLYADRLVPIINDFLALKEPDAARSEDVPRGTAVILFTDIVDSTALTERMGDAAFRAASRAVDEQTREAIRAAGGTPVEGKVLGDGVMAVFASAAQAIEAARRCIELSAESELRLHVGLHAGDVIREANNVYGGAVNIASRICGLCEPGEILVSQTIRDLARTSAGVTFDDRGARAKGIDDPMRVFAVRTQSG